MKFGEGENISPGRGRIDPHFTSENLAVKLLGKFVINPLEIRKIDKYLRIKSVTNNLSVRDRNPN